MAHTPNPADMVGTPRSEAVGESSVLQYVVAEDPPEGERSQEWRELRSGQPEEAASKEIRGGEVISDPGADFWEAIVDTNQDPVALALGKAVPQGNVKEGTSLLEADNPVGVERIEVASDRRAGVTQPAPQDLLTTPAQAEQSPEEPREDLTPPEAPDERSEAPERMSDVDLAEALDAAFTVPKLRALIADNDLELEGVTSGSTKGDIIEALVDFAPEVASEAVLAEQGEGEGDDEG